MQGKISKCVLSGRIPLNSGQILQMRRKEVYDQYRKEVGDQYRMFKSRMRKFPENQRIPREQNNYALTSFGLSLPAAKSMAF